MEPRSTTPSPSTASNLLATSCPTIGSGHPDSNDPDAMATSQTELLRADVDRLLLAAGAQRRYQHNHYTTTTTTHPHHAQHDPRRRLAVSAGSQLYGATDVDSLHEVVIDESGPQPPPSAANGHHPKTQTPVPAGVSHTSAMLHFCKRRFLLPFVQLLGLVGLRPASVEASACSFWLGHVQTLCVLTVLLFGYALQFVASFRRDRGIWHGLDGSKPQHPPLHLGETLFVYAIPAALHACGYATALGALRLRDREHLQNLCERVFIRCGSRAEAARLVAALWAYCAAAAVWLTLMTVGIVGAELWRTQCDSDDGSVCAEPGGNGTTTMAVGVQPLRLRFFERPPPDAVETVRWLLLAVVWAHDVVQMVVVTTYAVQCHLLRALLGNLRRKLVRNTIDPMDWMKEMCEFRKLLHHLNRRIATPVCWFILMNLIYTLASLAYACARYAAWTTTSHVPLSSVLTSAANVSLWLAAALAPFFQAAALTLRCEHIQTSGHQVRVRPFGHHRTSADDLNAVLLYASSLRMSAKLFRMPVQGNYLFFVMVCLVVGVLTLGMCLNVQVSVV